MSCNKYKMIWLKLEKQMLSRSVCWVWALDSPGVADEKKNSSIIKKENGHFVRPNCPVGVVNVCFMYNIKPSPGFPCLERGSSSFEKGQPGMHQGAVGKGWGCLLWRPWGKGQAMSCQGLGCRKSWHGKGVAEGLAQRNVFVEPVSIIFQESFTRWKATMTLHCGCIRHICP